MSLVRLLELTTLAVASKVEPQFVMTSRDNLTCPDGYSPILDVNSCAAAAEAQQPWSLEACTPEGDGKSWTDFVDEVDVPGEGDFDLQTDCHPFGCAYRSQYNPMRNACDLVLNNNTHSTVTADSSCMKRFFSPATYVFCQLAKYDPATKLGQAIVLKSAHGKFVVAKNGEIHANAGDQKTSSTLTVEQNGDGTVSFKTQEDKYVVAESNGQLNANRAMKSSWEKFQVEYNKDDQTFSFKSHHGKYIVAESDGRLNANRAYKMAWEKFKAIQATSPATSGDMRVLGGNFVGGSCDYANEVDGGAKSPAATSPHIATGRYCGVNAKLFAAGRGCGACYNVSYNGEGGTNPGSAGWEVVQVVNSADIDFACTKDVFQSITGASTGVFPITYNKIACEVDSSVGVATVLDGNDADYTKAIFSDLPYAVSSAKLKVGPKSFPMEHVVGGATFSTYQPGAMPVGGSASFELTLADGSINEVAPCFSTWPVATGSSCVPASVHRVTAGDSNTTVV
jgi:hypothetical protein